MSSTAPDRRAALIIAILAVLPCRSSAAAAPAGKLVESIREMSRQAERPFFLSVAHTAPQWPLQARPEDIDKYRGRYDQGWHALRAERYERQVALGQVDARTHPLPSLMGWGPDWEALPPERRRFEAR